MDWRYVHDELSLRGQGAGMSNPDLARLGKLIWMSTRRPRSLQRGRGEGGEGFSQHAVGTIIKSISRRVSGSALSSRFSLHLASLNPIIEAAGGLGYTLATPLCRSTSENRSLGGRLTTL